MEFLIAAFVAFGLGWWYGRPKGAPAPALPAKDAVRDMPVKDMPPGGYVHEWPAPVGPSAAEMMEFLTLTPYEDPVEGASLPGDVRERPVGDGRRSSGDCSTEVCVGPSNPPSNPAGNAPRTNIASNPLHQWCYAVQPGDTAGNIAMRFVGSRERFVELLVANPSKPQITDPEVNFADLCKGERLFIPKSWNAWIDEAGNRRGGYAPFPPFDGLPAYPALAKNALSAGFVPWPPDAPTGWQAIPFSLPGG